ncbi:hypothetical protein [Aureivirga marina]|uniref:hypothetical protein n=1 Tax=Aureivirga marina TaxID=1182451 RepID=UPI0018CA6296|nr:hypothetical protein [Aureivirga marina]
MKRNLQILKSFWFLLALILLLLNDFVLKGFYNNWLTGKLSDFAGLFIFPLFWTAFFSKHKRILFWLTGLFFIFWKSPFSQIIIDTWNNFGIFSISRVVDYSDLIALLVLPLSFYFESKKEKITTIRLSPIIPLTFAIFAFVATSRHQKIIKENLITFHIKHFSKDSLINVIKQSEFNVDFDDQQNSKYNEKYLIFRKINNQIYDLVVSIDDFNEVDSTVKITLYYWDVVSEKSENKDKKKILFNQEKEYIKKIFEEEVIKKIEKDYYKKN